MFERKFEFTVHHPLEVCEERVHEMEKSGCRNPLNTTTVETISKNHAEYLEVYMSDSLPIRYRRIIRIEGLIEVLNEGECVVTGIVYLKGYLPLLIWVVAIPVIALFYRWNDPSISMGVPFPIWAVIVWYEFIYSRNHFVRQLEKALTQPKKKKD